MKRRSFLKEASMGAAALGTLGGILPLEGAVPAQSGKALLPPVPADGSVRVAVVQQNGNPGKVEENREKALGFASEALQQNADVILFHEEMLVGYVENLQKLAEPLNGPTTQAFQKLLQGTETRVIYGLTERDGENYYISAPIVSASGVVANYRKTHLWWKAEGLRHEPTFYKPGNQLVTFDVKGFKSGIMICYDGGFPEMTRSYANLGCSMLFWMNNRRSRGHKEVQRLAFINSMIMPTSCCCGPNERGQHCSGGSNITGAKGELIEDIWDKEGIIIQDLYPGEVEAIRNKNPLFNGLRPELYYYG